MSFKVEQIVNCKVSCDNEFDDYELHMQGVVAHIHTPTRISVTLESGGAQGFHNIFTEQFTLRKNGKWVRRGVMMDRGWVLT